MILTTKRSSRFLLRRRLTAIASAVMPAALRKRRNWVEPLEMRILFSGDGLTGSYFNNIALTGTAALKRVDPTVNFNWGEGSPGAGVNVDNFAARWTGQVQATTTGATTFYTSTDDGVRLWVNGTQIINDWIDHSNTTDSATVTLTAGQKYDLKMEYYDSGWDAIAMLAWSTASQSKTPIPQSALFSTTTVSVPDTTPPSVPMNLASPGKTDTSVSLSWTASTDDVAVSRYDIYRNSTKVGSSTSTSYTDSGLSASTSYSYFVKAIDTSSNASAASSALSVTTATAAVGGSGTGLTGTYFDNIDLTNQKLTRTDATVNFNWGGGSPDASIGVDTFSARWTGQIQAKFSETYTFTLNSDDGSRMSVNGTQIINAWSDHSAGDYSGTFAMTAGQKYSVVIEYYENAYDASMNLYWSSGSQAKQIVPQAQLYPAAITSDTSPPTAPGSLSLVSKSDTSITMNWNASTDNVGVTAYDIYRGGTKIDSVGGTTLNYTDSNLLGGSTYSYTVLARDAAGNSSTASNPLSVTTNTTGVGGNGTGLSAQYFDNTDFTSLKVSRTDATVDFDWGSGSPDASVGADTFSARWTGQVLAKYSEMYTFYTSADDGVRLWVNNRLLVNRWTDASGNEDSGTIMLTAGTKYPITIEYYENGGGASAKLSWSSSTQGKQIVPQQYLYTGTNATSPAIAGNWNLAFNDDFNSLNSNVWGQRYWWNGDKGQQVTFTPNNVAVANGVLTITAKKQTATAFDGTVNQYTSGLLTTGGTKDGSTAPGFSYTYGYMEARIKIPAGQGLWPSFWALPANYDDYQGELDAMEIVASRPNIHEMHYHRQGWESGNTWDAGKSLGDDYHVYALDWEPDHIAWYVDGVERYRYTSKSGTDIVNQPMYFILNLDAGGPWAGSIDSTTPLPAQMSVDYVRLWQQAK